MTNTTRYTRQLPLFGKEGQIKLADATVFIAGAGGLGSPVATYLAVAGVGELIIADDDLVQESNLNRQFLHVNRNIGMKKVYSAAETLSALNPDITLTAIPERITPETIKGMTKDADILVDATDNFATRYLLNEASLDAEIPLVHGAVEGFSGQMTTVIPGETPCLECLFPHPPPERETPVIGATAGVIGSLQAMEVIKYITGSGRLLAGRLLIWDGLSGRTEYLSLSPRQDCNVCQKHTASTS
nr:HesA/MoeB/ThiF family protein [uncultured Methanospirillum sp.]